MDINHAPNQCPHCGELEATCENCQYYEELGRVRQVTDKHADFYNDLLKQGKIEDGRAFLVEYSGNRKPNEKIVTMISAEYDALHAENERYRAIVATLAGWHDDLYEECKTRGTALVTLTDIIGIDDVENLCEQAWKMTKGDGDGE